MTDPQTDWLARVAGIRRWGRGGERAAHKPLLLLYILGAVQRVGSSEVAYKGSEEELHYLLAAYGPPRKTTPAFPFWHLQSDGLWDLKSRSGKPLGPGPRKLRDADAVGRLTAEFERALMRDSQLLRRLVRQLLEENWPASLHEEIANAAGIDLDGDEDSSVVGIQERPRRPYRDPAFRDHVLMAYRYRCAFCGYDGRLNTGVVGLDAAHVRWRAFRGPDSIDNGIALCSAHHRLFDLGILGLSTDRVINVSPLFVGDSDAAHHLVHDLEGRPAALPRPKEPPPELKHVAWHNKEVFKRPRRRAEGEQRERARSQR